MKSPKAINRFMFLFLLWEIFPVNIIVLLSAGIITKAFPDMDYTAYCINLQAVYDLFLMLIPILFVTLYILKDNAADIIPLKPLSVWNIIYIVMIGFLMLPVMGFISYVTSFFCPPINTEVEEAVLSAPLIVSFLIMAVCPALFEETLFRGIVFGSARRFSQKKALLLSAMYFGLFHLNGYQIPYAIFAGFILALMVYATGSIFASMLLHLFINGYQVLSYYALSSSAEIMAEEAITDINPVYMTVLALIFVVLLVLMIRGFLRYNKKRNENYGKAAENGTETDGKFFDRYIIGSFIIFILYSVFISFAEKIAALS